MTGRMETVESFTLKGNEFKTGEIVKVFNSTDWSKTGDIGDNSQFFQDAKILSMYRYKSYYGYEDWCADVQFLHNDKVSNAHFIWGLKKIA
jgi:hypothetical protein